MTCVVGALVSTLPRLCILTRISGTSLIGTRGSPLARSTTELTPDRLSFADTITKNWSPVVASPALVTVTTLIEAAGGVISPTTISGVEVAFKLPPSVATAVKVFAPSSRLTGTEKLPSSGSDPVLNMTTVEPSGFFCVTSNDWNVASITIPCSVCTRFDVAPGTPNSIT